MSRANLARRPFTSRSGARLEFTELGFGTAPLGNLYRTITQETAQQTLQAAWDAGCRYFDTAPLYGLGLSETRLNHFLYGRPRDDYLLSTKIGRLLQPKDPSKGIDGGVFAAVLPFEPVLKVLVWERLSGLRASTLESWHVSGAGWFLEVVGFWPGPSGPGSTFSRCPGGAAAVSHQPSSPSISRLQSPVWCCARHASPPGCGASPRGRTHRPGSMVPSPRAWPLWLSLRSLSPASFSPLGARALWQKSPRRTQLECHSVFTPFVYLTHMAMWTRRAAFYLESQREAYL